jgi:integrase
MGTHGHRDKLGLALSIMGGMRLGEIAALTIGDVRGLDGRAVDIIHLAKHQTKGNRSRRVFVGGELRKILTAFLSHSQKLPDAAPWLRLRARRLTCHTVEGRGCEAQRACSATNRPAICLIKVNGHAQFLRYASSGSRSINLL